MTIAPFRREDVDHFLALAASERWVVDTWEFDYLQSAFPRGCFCARDEAGRLVGFITSLAHDRSGWIGNLIISPGARGRGIGRRLFLKAREALTASGARTIWLTASQAGRPLYAKLGFCTIDSIVRWSGLSAAPTPALIPPGAAPEPSIDCLGWGDNRERLLAATAARGRVLAASNGFAVIQPCNQSVQIGPFSALDAGCAGVLLDSALASIPPDVEILIDAPAGNQAGTDLLEARGFRIRGTNQLMFAGERPAYCPGYIYGLASMGSMG